MAFGKKKPQLTFEEGIARWMKRRDQAPLPRVYRAMWKKDVRFRDDISDRELFNEQFIESRLTTPSLVDTLYITSMMHTISLVVGIAATVTEPASWLTWVLVYVGWNTPFFFPLWLLSKPVGGIRFNRQAQVVQTMRGIGGVLTVPWRDVRPFMRDIGMGRVELRLAFPPPVGVRGRKGILWLDGEFDSLDDSAIDTVARRFEFIRRYMEEGLDAIRPTQNLDVYRKPSGPSRLNSFYWPGFGPLIDRWVDHWQSQFRWPDEAQRLGLPGADVSGYDTRPVPSHKHIFYRYDPREGCFYLCDVNGERLPNLVDTDLENAANEA
jgi:hypothetical protein